MPQLRLKAINNALHAKGVEKRLFKGKDYFYFSGGSTPYWPSTSVYVSKLNDLTIDQWLEEYRSLLAQSRGLE